MKGYAMLRKLLLGAALSLAFSAPAAAQTGAFGTGSYSSATVGTTDAVIVAAASPATRFLDIYNDSATATVCINFGATATISGTTCAAGEITLPPLWHRSWENSFVPSDAIHAISSAAATPVTVGVRGS